MTLDGKVIVVTGGAGLLGRGFCTAIAGQGGVAVVADLNIEGASRVANEIRASGGQAEAGQVDITSLDSVEALIARLHDTFGHIDGVVNNAFPRNETWGRKLEDVTYADFCEHLNSHLGGYFLVSQRFALYFRQHGGGNIVNMGSIYGAMAPRFEVYADTSMTSAVAYAAIKSGIIHLTRYFAQYFKTDGIRCNSLSPGGILDNQPAPFLEHYREHCAAKGMLDPQDVAGTLVYLLSDAARYVTGQNLIVDDGFSL